MKELRRKLYSKEYNKLRYLKVIKINRKVDNLKKKIYDKKYRNLNKDKIKETNRCQKKKKKNLQLEWDFLNPCIK